MTSRGKIELLHKAISMSGNEFAMGYDDSGCFWRFYYGNRGAGSMMEGWPTFQSESPEVEEALQEFMDFLTAPPKQEVDKKGASNADQ